MVTYYADECARFWGHGRGTQQGVDLADVRAGQRALDAVGARVLDFHVEGQRRVRRVGGRPSLHLRERVTEGDDGGLPIHVRNV